MKVVVADTSPLNYLILIDSVDILPRLFGNILVPPQVIAELVDSGTPAPVRQWTERRPDWLQIRPAPDCDDPSLNHLDLGERAAILLAEAQTEDVLLLIDDASGRMAAAERGIASVGTLGVLRAASKLNMVDLHGALHRLLDTNFRVSKRLIDDLISEVRKRRSHSGE
jgi:predicted nucleic acid-binding protein